MALSIPISVGVKPLEHANVQVQTPVLALIHNSSYLLISCSSVCHLQKTITVISSSIKSKSMHAWCKAYVPSSTCHKNLVLEVLQVHRRLSIHICFAMREAGLHPKWRNTHSLPANPSYAAQVGINYT